jgi:hypothetical protein
MPGTEEFKAVEDAEYQQKNKILQRKAELAQTEEERTEAREAMLSDYEAKEASRIAQLREAVKPDRATGEIDQARIDKLSQPTPHPFAAKQQAAAYKPQGPPSDPNKPFAQVGGQQWVWNAAKNDWEPYKAKQGA